MGQDKHQGLPTHIGNSQATRSTHHQGHRQRTRKGEDLGSMPLEAFIERMEKAQKDLLEQLWPDRQDGLPISTPEEAVILAIPKSVTLTSPVSSTRMMLAGLISL